MKSTISYAFSEMLRRQFARSAAYQTLQPPPDRVQEPGLAMPSKGRRGRVRFDGTERHVQCIWFDPELRPATLHTSAREALQVEHPGIWNLEAGPDFLGAVLRLGEGGRRIQGDVEIHIGPEGWKQHGHQGDPRYNQVRCHVTWLPGTVCGDLLPPGTVQVSLQESCTRNPAFAFESIDVTAYPYAARAQIPPCSEVLRHWMGDGKGALLDAAGEERLRSKAARMAERIEAVGEEQALYEEIMSALGYKHNKQTFRRLATLVPVEKLRACAEEDALDAYAVLAGAAGLLPDQLSREWDEETTSFMRSLWRRWWRLRDESWSDGLRPEDWRLSGLRPANHPLRRLMAAARIFANPGMPESGWRAAASLPPAEAIAHAKSAWQSGNEGYWSRRLAIGGRRQDSEVALIGDARGDAILANVFVPYCACIGGSQAPGDLLNQLKSDEENELVRRTANFLFGPDQAPSLYRNALRRQGLIQIFFDYCLIDRSRCATCTLPAALRAYQGHFSDRS
jgi:hypothetical protein